ncbi:MAG: Ig-like domain-containing protein [Anaerolineales bacterium]
MTSRRTLLFLNALLIAVLACSLPSILSPAEPTPQRTSATDEPVNLSPTELPALPPEVIESQPAVGEKLDPAAGFTLYFDQPMDRASVEAAFSLNPSAAGDISWQDDRTLSFMPGEPLARETEYQITIDVEARSAQGLAPTEPLTRSFTTAGFAEVTQVQPAPSASGVNPTSRIMVAFNQPMVALLVDQDQPQPLRFDPPIRGQGEWVGTSLYTFRPDPALPAGSSITASVEPGITAPDGAVLNAGFTWTFSTTRPQLIEAKPENGATGVPLDPELRLQFNTPLSAASFEGAFRLQDPDGRAVGGEFEWNEASDQLIFEPSERLAYGTNYSVNFDGATGPAGTPLSGSTSLAFTTVPEPAFLRSTPSPGGTKSVQSSLHLYFSGPMSETSLFENLSIQPEVESLSVGWDSQQYILFVHGDFQPDQSYTLSLGPAEDSYGTPLAEEVSFSFRTENHPPALDYSRYHNVLTFSHDRQHNLLVRARNINQVQLTLNRLTIDQFLEARRNPLDYVFHGQPIGQEMRRWATTVSPARNVYQLIEIPLVDNGSLPTGVYQILIDTPEDNRSPSGRLLLVRGTELVLKSANNQALIWAVDLANGDPRETFEVQSLTNEGELLSEPQPGSEGFVEFELDPDQVDSTGFAVMTGEPGNPAFGLTHSQWDQGIAPYNFGVPSTAAAESEKTYLYTDRPLYRPGQRVYFKGAQRQITPEGFALPESSSTEIEIYTPNGRKLQEVKVALSDFGTFHGSFNLASEAPLGLYRMSTGRETMFFEVAAYRKPEFEIELTPSHEDRIVGQSLTVDVEATYFFGAPVANQEVSWQVYGNRYRPPDLPSPFNFHYLPFFNFAPTASIAEGSGVTDELGRLQIDIPTDIEEPRPLELTVQASIDQEGELPVSSRTSVNLHPSEIYLSVVPSEYSLRAGTATTFRLHTIDYLGEPLANQPAEIEVYRVRWEQYIAENGELDWREREALVNRDQLRTESDGSVLASFLPEQAGRYEIRATSQDNAGREAEASATVFVIGREGSPWRQSEANQIQLVPDKEQYEPGDTAQVLVPSPFQVPAKALITLEREGVLSREVIDVPPEGEMLEIPIQTGHIPNVYLSVILLRPGDEEAAPIGAAGLINLTVSAESQRIQVEIASESAQAEPGEDVTYQLLASDAEGKPVQAEFSLGLVDEALLALKEPNSPDPFEALYKERPLAVSTGLGLALSGEDLQVEDAPMGLGGGGGGDAAPITVRQQFEDTAYWNPTVITDNEGRAEVTVSLPDNLTSWRMEARGLTEDAQAGSAEHSLTVRKPLLIRPQTPRFFTAGDLATVAGVVHNNTDQALTADVRLSANGALIQSAETTTITIPAGGSERVEWQLRIEEVEGVGLTFFAEGGGYRDATTPTIGSVQGGQIPVLRYSTPSTEATTGWMPEAGSRTESVALPATFDPTQGDLTVSLEPSLGSVVFRGMAALDAYPHETTNHLAARLMASAASLGLATRVDEPTRLSAESLEAEVLETRQALIGRQNNDGGWGWWGRSTSDVYLTAYVLESLLEAEAAGAVSDERVIERAVEWLRASMAPPSSLDPAGLLRQAYVVRVLNMTEADYSTSLRALALQADRLPLRAKAFVVEGLTASAPSDASLPALIADLESAAHLSATGTHWDSEIEELRYYAGGVETTAHVLRALLAANQDSPNLSGAVRWLVLNRDRGGGWRTSTNTSWATVALLQWIERHGAWQAEYDYQLRLNGASRAEGRFEESGISNGAQVITPISELTSEQANALTIERGEGPGTLSYTAHLITYLPASEVSPSSRGLSIERRYYLDDGTCDFDENPCQAVESAEVGDNLLVRLTITAPSEVYYLTAEDRFGAGLEAINPSFRTSAERPDPLLERTGLLWLGWFFDHIELDDERLVLFADYLPAGTYTYAYRLHASFAGDYQTLPARTWLTHFPEVSGQSAGMEFTIQP